MPHEVPSKRCKMACNFAIENQITAAILINEEMIQQNPVHVKCKMQKDEFSWLIGIWSLKLKNKVEKLQLGWLV